MPDDQSIKEGGTDLSEKPIRPKDGKLCEITGRPGWGNVPVKTKVFQLSIGGSNLQSKGETRTPFRKKT